MTLIKMLVKIVIIQLLGLFIILTNVIELQYNYFYNVLFDTHLIIVLLHMPMLNMYVVSRSDDVTNASNTSQGMAHASANTTTTYDAASK